MDIFTFAIIYFACASPVVMHSILSNDNGGKNGVASAILRAMFWPIFCGKILIYNLGKRRTSASEARLKMARSVRDEIESEYFGSLPASEVFELRGVFDRYFALNEAAFDGAIDNGSKEFLAIAGNKNLEVAKACIDRKMLLRLSKHSDEARKDFADFLSSTNINEDSISKLTSLTGDVLLESLLRSNAMNTGFVRTKISRKAA